MKELEILKLIKEKDIPSLPETAIKVMKMIMDPTVREEICQIPKTGGGRGS